RGARQGHLIAAPHSRPHRPRAARNSQRVQKSRLQDRSCGSGSRGPAKNRDFHAAMGCPPNARAAYESIANAPTAPRNISPSWAGARGEMSPLSPESPRVVSLRCQSLIAIGGEADIARASWACRSEATQSHLIASQRYLSYLVWLDVRSARITILSDTLYPSRTVPFLARRVLEQERRQRGRKVYSLHAPEVECIGKGKAHRPYEFGVKVSVATTVKHSAGGQFVTHA